MKKLVLYPLMLLLFAALPACNEGDEGTNPDNSGTPAGQLTGATDCKTFNGPALDGSMGSGESCLEYTYDAATKKLALKHVNAGFNCCPGELSAVITVEENIITIAEKEREAGCHCNCLFDLTFEITELPPGSYRIVVVEPYLNTEDAPLSFEADLIAQPAGQSCVPRAHYPWGL